MLCAECVAGKSGRSCGPPMGANGGLPIAALEVPQILWGTPMSFDRAP
jgi:hypothetical protein